MTQPTTLLDTHPHLGEAQWRAWWEQDHTGEHPGQRFSQVLGHEYTKARCTRCGGQDRRHIVIDRLLVGANVGTYTTTALHRCDDCRAGGLSTYRKPWSSDPVR
jgi:hypothetical protein